MLIDDRIDVLAVQETKLYCDDHIGKALEPLFSVYDALISHPVGTSAGCLLFLKKTLLLTVITLTTDEKGSFFV